MIANFFSGMAAAFRNVLPNSQLLPLDSTENWGNVLSTIESEAGITVTHRTALTVAPVWQAVTMISGDLASMTLNCYRRLPGDDREIDYDHPAQVLVSVQANEEIAAYEFWRRLVLHALLWGNGYAWISRAGGRLGNPDGLYNLLPDRTVPYRNRQTGGLYYVTEVNNELTPLFPEEVLHVKGPSLEYDRGIDLVRVARNAMGLFLAAEAFNSKFFASGSQSGGILEIPAHYTEKAAKKLEEGFSTKYAGKENFFKVVILRDGAKFHQTTIDAQKAQMHELRADQVRDVARFFNLPPFKLGLEDSVSYNSAEMGQLIYLTGCLNHWRLAVGAECAMKLLTSPERQKTHYFEHNVSNLIELDFKTLNEVLEIQRRNEVITANEWRRKINLPRRQDPGGETYLNPNTRSAGGEEPARGAEVPGELLDLPDVRQKYAFDCGAAAIASVCGFFRVGPENYGEFISGLGTTPRDGTAPEAMVDFLNDLGLVTTSGPGMTVNDLKKFLTAGVPVIVPCQMYGLTPEYDQEEEDNLTGHYVVVIGLGLGMVFVQDPVAGRLMISEKEFDQRWHDREADGVVDDHFGIAISDAVVMIAEDAESEQADGKPTDSPTPDNSDQIPELKVFLSSTFVDLHAHRAHALSELRDASVEVDPMENWPAAAEEPKEFSQERMDGVDLVVLLVSFRRGFIPPGETKSITQMEYDHAIAHGIDVLPFLLGDDEPWPSEFDDRETDPGINQWREELKLTHGVETFGAEPLSLDVAPSVLRWAKEHGRLTGSDGAAQGNQPSESVGETVSDGTGKIQVGGDVQATALNGAQIVALLGLTDKIIAKQMPGTGAKAIIRAAFPLLSDQLINEIVDNLEKFNPPEPEAEPPIPGLKKEPEPPSEKLPPEESPAPPESSGENCLADCRIGLQALFIDAVNRVARRVCFDARSAAKKPGKFLAWLDGKAFEHRPIFDAAIRPVLQALGPLQPASFSVDAMAVALDGRFFGNLLEGLGPVVEPPYQQMELETNVDRQCQEFEQVIAGQILRLVFLE